MSRKARLWIGVTLLLVIAFNYAMIGFPLLNRSASIEDKSKAIMIKQVKSGGGFKNADEEYILELFRREKAAIEVKVLMLNCIAASLVIFVASWTIFGLLIPRKK